MSDKNKKPVVRVLDTNHTYTIEGHEKLKADVIRDNYARISKLSEEELLEERARYEQMLSDAIGEGRELEEELTTLRKKKALRDEMLARAASAEYLEKSVVDIMDRLKTRKKSFIENISAKQQGKSETVETAQRGWDSVGQVHDLEQFTKRLAITLERIHRARDQRIAEANGTSAPPENNGL